MRLTIEGSVCLANPVLEIAALERTSPPSLTMGSVFACQQWLGAFRTDCVEPLKQVADPRKVANGGELLDALEK